MEEYVRETIGGPIYKGRHQRREIGTKVLSFLTDLHNLFVTIPWVVAGVGLVVAVTVPFWV